MQKSNSVYVGAFPPQYATRCIGAYRGVCVVRIEVKDLVRKSVTVPDTKAICPDALLRPNHSDAYPDLEGCS